VHHTLLSAINQVNIFFIGYTRLLRCFGRMVEELARELHLTNKGFPGLILRGGVGKPHPARA
jgi:hypothetical protein